MIASQPKRKLQDVFKTVGLPPYTYVKPAHFGEVRADVQQNGKHLLIEGPSGIGKTCVVYKVFEELSWVNGVHFDYISGRDADALDRVLSFLANANQGQQNSSPIAVIDDFHLFTRERRASIGAQLKRLSDRVFEQVAPPKVIMIGIPTTGTSLLADAYDLGPRLGTYRFARASDLEIDKLISEGESALNVIFEDRDILLSESAGNFWMAQHICHKVSAIQEVYETVDDVKILNFDLLSIRQKIMIELSSRYMSTAKTFAKGKKWRPGGNKPYLDVLQALAKFPDLVVTYDKILSLVPDRRRPGVKAIRPRISEVLFDPQKGADLRRQIAFDPDSGFSIEDPLFRYFLSNLNMDDLYRELGIESASLEDSRLYAYDVGFSFAGETRRLVELINEQLKNEDVVTFYDFDQQAILLALDLEEVLRKIYSESCRFYLVFLEASYSAKVWTKFEKDIMTSSRRKNHIIPVVLDDQGNRGAVGISATIGKIDLRDVWAEVALSGAADTELLNSIRNRCVIPLLEKVSSPDIVLT